MYKRDVRRWLRKQYTGDAQPWPRPVRWVIIAFAMVLFIAKLAGWL